MKKISSQHPIRFTNVTDFLLRPKTEKQRRKIVAVICRKLILIVLFIKTHHLHY